jgi:hydrogenase maturation protease
MSNSSADHKPVAVIGIGNYLRGDDGAGIHAVDRLREQEANRLADIIDGATAGPGLKFFIEDRDKVIFIDAGTFGKAPGTFVRFTPAEIRTRKELSGLSLHEFDLISFLSSPPPGMKLPPDLVIYCIEPASMEPGDRLSPEVDAGLSRLVAEVLEEIKS